MINFEPAVSFKARICCFIDFQIVLNYIIKMYLIYFNISVMYLSLLFHHVNVESLRNVFITLRL